MEKLCTALYKLLMLLKWWIAQKQTWMNDSFNGNLKHTNKTVYLCPHILELLNYGNIIPPSTLSDLQSVQTDIKVKCYKL